MKPSLRIGKFYCTSPNAARVQLCSVIYGYIAVAITRKALGISTNLTAFVQVFSVYARSPVPILTGVLKLDTNYQWVYTADLLTLNDLWWSASGRYRWPGPGEVLGQVKIVVIPVSDCA